MNINEKLDAIFKAYDIRGLVGSTIDDDIVKAVGYGFAKTIEHNGTILVGYDMRPSSVSFANSFAEGCLQGGACIVKILGLTSTDEQYFASGLFNANSAMFTASHNPAEYNGIKLSRAGAKGISLDTGLSLVKESALQYLTDGLQVEHDGIIEHIDVMQDYVKHLRSLVPLEDAKPLKIVVDAANGMAGLTVPAIFGDGAGLNPLPFEIVPMYFELDGTFPNHEANPLDPKNLVDLQKAVVEHKADLGLAFDGDADRCFIVDENGDPVSPSALGSIIALREIRAARKDNPNAPVTVLYSLTTSRVLSETIASENAEGIRIRVGHSPAKNEMERTGAVFGGEHSAHYYFSSFWGADSGVLAALHIIAELNSTGMKMSELGNKYTPYFASGEINSIVESVQASTDKVHSEFKDNCNIDFMDGMTVSFEAGKDWFWFNLRPSNTEPLLRLNVESNNHMLMEAIRDDVLKMIRK